MTLYTFSCTTMKDNATAVVDGEATIANDTRIHARTVTHDTQSYVLISRHIYCATASCPGFIK